MAREIVDFVRYTAPDGTYPYGNIKDNTAGMNDGTGVSVLTNGDIHQFFQRLLQTSGIAINNLPDNLDNGFQLFESYLIGINAHVGNLIKYIFGGGYDANTVYILDGSSSRSANGIALYNYNIYYLSGNSGPSCGGSLVDVINFPDPTEVTDGLAVLTVQCGTSGSGLCDFADRVFINVDTVIPTTDLATGWEGTPVFDLTYRICPDGYVEWSGTAVVDNASRTSVIIPAGVLPASACPPSGRYYIIPMTYKATAIGQSIFATLKIKDDGEVSTDSNPPMNVDDIFFFDGVRYRNY